MSELVVEATGLHTHYGASHILRGVDFTVARGETVGLLGRNGMGKTTLVHTVMQLLRPWSGTVQ